MSDKTLILNTQQILQKVNRIAYQIYEDNCYEKEITVVGIDKKGYLIAKLIADQLKNISDLKITLAKLTIDKENAHSNNEKLDVDSQSLNDKVVILVDDVLNTGKSLIFGVKYLLNFPIKKMSTAVLVDRNNKKYPIGTHYVGLALSTTLKNHISIEFRSKDIKAYLS